ncbi:hypothetical protein [Mucilaginibacter lacusdianchii]|uniref:hypothetical protein n=1 Tax=Mucilaginibacter lacusdianchii TaxID=2684211 RepID=UPI00131C2DAD|nr:hypothetical protein [Mucilaginibacter sp. JXJ CY 39]
MTNPANSHDKPSPSDTPSDRPDDNGGKAVIRKPDLEYKADEPDFGNIAKQHEQDEEPVNPVKTPPEEFKNPENSTQPPPTHEQRDDL